MALVWDEIKGWHVEEVQQPKEEFKPERVPSEALEDWDNFYHWVTRGATPDDPWKRHGDSFD